MALGKQVLHYRTKAGLTLEQLSELSGVERGTIGALEIRDSKRSQYARQLAASFGLTVEMLEDENVDHDVALGAITVADSNVGDALVVKTLALLPLVGEVKGGENGYLEELQYPVGHGEGVVEYPTADPNAYALRVRGDSMHPRYRAGEFVIVEPNIEPQPGDDVVVLCANGRKMLKQLNWRRDGEVQLLSINNGYAPLTLPMSEIESIQLAAGRARRSALRRL